MSDKPAAERRLVTMLFTDICGYTALSEAVDPEEVEELLEGFRGLASDVIQEHGGMINQFMGDAFLALFGLPCAHDDDAQRAANAALAMHAEFAERIRPYEQRWGRQLALHSGIETGVVIAKRGDPRAGLAYAVNGDAVNVAARLLAMAGPSELLVGPRTKSLISAFFVLDAPRMLALKGGNRASAARRRGRGTARGGRARRADSSRRRAFARARGNGRQPVVHRGAMSIAARESRRRARWRRAARHELVRRASGADVRGSRDPFQARRLGSSRRRSAAFGRGVGGRISGTHPGPDRLGAGSALGSPAAPRAGGVDPES